MERFSAGLKSSSPRWSRGLPPKACTSFSQPRKADL